MEDDKKYTKYLRRLNISNDSSYGELECCPWYTAQLISALPVITFPVGVAEWWIIKWVG